MPEVTGLLLVDKPAGPSSFGVLRGLRPALGRKLGHAGTLDPFATGPAAGGRRPGDAACDLPLRPGQGLLTPSCSSAPSRRRSTPRARSRPAGRPPTPTPWPRAAAALVGEIVQTVPAASAVKVDGERAYARMRRGEAVEPPPRQVTIHRLDVSGFDAATAARVDRGRLLEGHVRAPARRRPRRRRPAPAPTAWSCGARTSAASTWPTPARRTRSPRDPLGPLVPLGRRRAAAPAARGRSTTPSSATSPTAGRCGGRARTASPACVHDGELRAVAEPRGERLQPVVVL